MGLIGGYLFYMAEVRRQKQLEASRASGKGRETEPVLTTDTSVSDPNLLQTDEDILSNMGVLVDRSEGVDAVKNEAFIGRYVEEDGTSGFGDAG